MSIRRFVLRRLAFLIPILIGIALVTFLLTRVLPGDPLYVLLSPYATEADVQQRQAELGLDRPLIEQFGIYLRDLSRGDLGYSYRTRQPVVDDLRARLPPTIELGVFALLVAIPVGILLGVESAIRRSRPFDRVARWMTVAGASVPPFFVGLMLIYIFYAVLNVAPPPLGRLGALNLPERITGIVLVDALLAGDFATSRSALAHLLLPGLTLALALIAPIARLTRNGMLEALGSRYVQTGLAMGLPFRRVAYQDALRNAMLPTLTAIGFLSGWALGGVVVVEVVFAWPGMGAYAVNSILNQDFNPVMGFVLVSALIYVAANLIVDVAYTLVDPRVKY